jgi:hypothetical protein
VTKILRYIADEVGIAQGRHAAAFLEMTKWGREESMVLAGLGGLSRQFLGED